MAMPLHGQPSDPARQPVRCRALIGKSGLLRRFSGNQRGIIIVMFALMLPVIIGFIGLGVEVAHWFSEKRDMQSAVDAAALAGAYEINEGRSASTLTVAQREAESNGWASSTGTITVRNNQYNSTYPASGSYTTDTNAVEVELTWDITPMFLGYFMSGDVSIDTRAVATLVAGTSTACLLSLGASNEEKALWVSGSAAVTMSGCSAATNSTHSSAFTTTSGLSVDCAYSAGGFSGTPTLTSCASTESNASTITDPYASKTKPVDSDFDDCDSAGDTSSSDGNDYVGPNADSTINPGVYCDITFSRQNKTLTMNAGTYYIDRGDLTSTGGTIDASAGVTIVFGDSTGAGGCGQVSFTGNSNLIITAPITEDGEPFTGIALYIGSDCDVDKELKIAGNNNSTVLGALYNPNGAIKITGNGSVSGTCMQLISDTMKITGNSDIGSSCDDVDITTATTGDYIGLVE
ncbi:MAG: hypothetical protein HQ494_07880 [Rhodospirillales bacterium]|nr:hypothetical protein [Rhodospirillales bacterium]